MRSLTGKNPVVPTRSDNLKGAFLMLAGMFVFSAVDAQAKYLTQTLPPMQIVWARQVGLFLGVLVLLSIKGTPVLKTNFLFWQIVRGICAALSAALFIIGVYFVPLADAVSVTFVAPLIVTMMGAFILGERVGIHRWTATIIGFLATLIVIRPGFASFHPGLLLPLTASCLFAARQVISRYIGTQDKTETTVTYTALTAFLLLSLALPFVWVPIETEMQIAILVLMSLMAALGELLVIKALEVGLAVVVSPLHYTIIIWASFYGYLLFGHLPDMWTLIGSSIIIASGLYVLHRERIRASDSSNAA